ncbi:glycosyltransferase family 39 protein [Rhodopirellula sp. MGV]|uniref:glycosyltransferase family 39 protein n=1 Tax=Rhodopirellula sp. MGV TaxID=2023130 RepID=UPI000B969767|nr:glycosyltransferase family 39 protein [Rhodopirellula sp. MGV]OYP35150.1 hypothetical protein CGZ80_12155 [Rhodopirellula sp. MGV]PNY36774.1 hypothetical protein C2E31_11230 [Rhodopirellula baltica]
MRHLMDQRGRSQKFYGELGFLCLAVVIGLIVRIAFLTQTMRSDEALTFNNFVQKPGELLHYALPNNQLFHTVLVRLTTAVLGADPWIIRLPAFLAGIVAIPLGWQFCRRLNNGRGGEFISAAIAVFPFFVLFSTNARGYTLLVCLCLLAGLHVQRILEDPNSTAIWPLAVFIALGFWTIPTMLYPATGIVFWLTLGLITKSDLAVRDGAWILVVLGIQIVVLTTAFYAPTLIREKGIEEVFFNRFAASLSTEQFYGGMGDNLTHTLRHLFRHVTWKLPLVVLAVCGFVASLMKREERLLLFLAGVSGGVASAFLLKQSLPFTRSWIFALPFLFVVADRGYTWIVSATPRLVTFACHLLIIGASVWFARDLVIHNRIAKYNDTGLFPEVIDVADYLTKVTQPGDKVISPIPNKEPLKYYLARAECPVQVDHRLRQPGRHFFVTRENLAPDGEGKLLATIGAARVFRMH